MVSRKHKIFYLAACVAVLAALSPATGYVSAQISSAQDFSEPGDCFDYLHLGDVSIKVFAQDDDYKAGDKANFTAVFYNLNDFAVADGSPYAQIFRKNPDSNSGQDYLMDQFFLEQPVSLAPNGQKQINFSWQIPAGVSEGQYVVGISLLEAKKMHLSGLPFNDGGYGGFAFFNIRPNENIEEIVLEKDKVKVNGELIASKDYFPIIAEEAAIAIEIPAYNVSARKIQAQISKKLYFWDNSAAGKFLQDTKETIMLEPEKEGGLNEILGKLKPGVYLYEITAQAARAKSMLQFRFFVRGEEVSARSGFLSLRKFPLVKNDKTYFVACFNSISDAESFNGKVYVALRDENNNVLAKGEYSGLLSPKMTALRKEFTAGKNYEKIWLDSIIYDAQGNLIDQTTLLFDCKRFADQVSKINVSVDNSSVKVIPKTFCDKSAQTTMSIEVIRQDGKMIFYEPNFKGNSFLKKIDFKVGESYKITAMADNIKQVLEYQHVKNDNKSEFWIISIVLSAIAAIFIFLKNKQNVK